MFPRRKNIQNTKFNMSLGTSVSKLVQPSIISEFQSRKVTYFDGADKKEAVSLVDDIYMLFNQQRLLSSGVGADTINAWLNSLTPKSDALSELRKKCTDEELIQICKSRYIQSPSELLAWSEYLNANYEGILSAARQQAAQQQAAQQAAHQAAQQAAQSSGSSSE